MSFCGKSLVGWSALWSCLVNGACTFDDTTETATCVFWRPLLTTVSGGSARVGLCGLPLTFTSSHHSLVIACHCNLEAECSVIYDHKVANPLP